MERRTWLVGPGTPWLWVTLSSGLNRTNTAPSNPAVPWGKAKYNLALSKGNYLLLQSPCHSPKPALSNGLYPTPSRIPGPPLSPALETPQCHWTSGRSLSVFLSFFPTLTSCHTPHSTVCPSARITDTSPNLRGCWPGSSLLLLIVYHFPQGVSLMSPTITSSSTVQPNRMISFGALLS